MRLFRLAKILSVSSRFGLDEMILEHEPSGRLAALSRLVHFWRRFDKPRAERLRLALEALGPIFVKFGQVLSTRRDLLPLDVADAVALAICHLWRGAGQARVAAALDQARRLQGRRGA